MVKTIRIKQRRGQEWNKIKSDRKKKLENGREDKEQEKKRKRGEGTEACRVR
jgi:hypothetical protein